MSASVRRRPRSASPAPKSTQSARREIAGWWARRRARRTPPDLALVLELLARELRGGASLAAAMAALPSDADLGLRELRRRVDQGAALGDELDRWSEGLDGRDSSLVRAVLRLGVSTGAALADALDRTAGVIRERRALDDELRALAAQSQASATMIAVAPLGFLIVFALADPSAMTFLVASPLGWACLLAGVALDLVGFWWMRRLVAGVVR